MPATTARKTKEPQIGYNLELVTQRIKAKPFIKWAGGKWQLIPLFAPHFPPLQQTNRCFEPFLGGAAVFFHLQHPRSFLSDSNAELVELYQTVREPGVGVSRRRVLGGSAAA